MPLKVHLQIQTPFIILSDWLHDENEATKHKHFFMPNSKVRYDYKNIFHKRNHTFFSSPLTAANPVLHML